MVTEDDGPRAVPGTLPTPPKTWNKAVFGTGISHDKLAAVRAVLPIETSCIAVASYLSGQCEWKTGARIAFHGAQVELAAGASSKLGGSWARRKVRSMVSIGLLEEDGRWGSGRKQGKMYRLILPVPVLDIIEPAFVRNYLSSTEGKFSDAEQLVQVLRGIFPNHKALDTLRATNALQDSMQSCSSEPELIARAVAGADRMGLHSIGKLTSPGGVVEVIRELGKNPDRIPALAESYRPSVETA